MIVIDKVLLSDEILTAQFVCDLARCKGACCEDGDAGAPLTVEELDAVKAAFEVVKPSLTPEGLAEIERVGLYRYDKAFGWVTPTVDGGICAYGYRDALGVIKCAFEDAYNRGLTTWKKPISCHLYPIKAKQSRYEDHELLNYEPREVLCSPACSLGRQLKVPVFRFLKEPLIRKYGTDFYAVLEKIAEDHFEATRP